MIYLTYRMYQKEFESLLDLQFKILVNPKGRRWGGTHVAIKKKLGWMNDSSAYGEGCKVLWGDTIQSNIDRYVTLFALPILRQVPKKFWSWNKQSKQLTLYDSICDYRSEDRPFNWEGFGYDYIFINEAGIVLRNRYLWENTILPMTLDNPNSKIILIGKPLGETYRGEPHPFYTLFTKGEEEKITEPDISKRKIISYRQTTFDNTHISKDDIEEMMLNMDPLTQQQEVYAEFVSRAGLLAIYTFDPKIHVSDKIERNRKNQLHLSFDFNVNPATCLISEHGHKTIELEGKSRSIPFIHYLDEVCLTKEQTNTNKTHIQQLCEIIKNKFPNTYYLVTGDSTGRGGHVTLKPKQNAWTEVIKHLNISDKQVTLKTNPEHDDSLRQCNVMFASTDRIEIRIHPRCKYTINDLNGIKTLEDGKIDKKESSVGHLFDALRYNKWTWFQDFVRYL